MSKICLLMQLFIFLVIGREANAARIVVLPPVTAEVYSGGYDTSSIPKRMCRRGFSFKEFLNDVPSYSQEKLLHGVWFNLVTSIRNISSTTQTATVRIKSVDFEASQWITTEAGIRDREFSQTYNSGYTRSVTLAAGATGTLTIQIGCQGDDTNRNCWAYAFPFRVGGVDVGSATTLFGTLPLFDLPGTAARKNFICYNLKAVTQMQIEVTQAQGAVLASVNTTEFAGGVLTQEPIRTFLQVNGGRAF